MKRPETHCTNNQKFLCVFVLFFEIPCPLLIDINFAEWSHTVGEKLFSDHE